MARCENQVEVRRTRGGEPITVRCGRWFNGERALCDPCDAEVLAEEETAMSFHRDAQYDERRYFDRVSDDIGQTVIAGEDMYDE